uniref:Uncharacterized protein n=1 Tax=Panagrolaimus sp. PS1159 TaxID=55785 RepID=A0AC35GCU7_9BILA
NDEEKGPLALIFVEPVPESTTTLTSSPSDSEPSEEANVRVKK